MAVESGHFGLSVADDAARFVASQLTGASEQDLVGQRIVVLGQLSRRPFAVWDGSRPSVDPLRLCVLLLQRGGELVVLDRPRNRLLIERLLVLAAQTDGRVRGGCLLETDLSTAFRGAAAALLLPGWPVGRSLAWGALCGQMRSGGQLFDLRPGPCLERPAARGLQVWHLGSPGSSL
jgi:hypothetical protein